MQTASKYIEYNAYKDLPRNLCFDEIKTAENKMSFIFADAETGRLIDIVDARNYIKLKNYFMRIPLKIRRKVQTICIDIYPPYMKLIRELFPKTDIIIDRFHIVQNINREFNKYRIEVMNRYKNKEKGIYTKLKKYWKLLLKDETEIQYAKKHYSKTFGRAVSNKQVLDYLLSLDKTLAANYKIMQDIRYALKTKNVERFKESIQVKTIKYSKGITKAINTIKKYEKYMINSIIYPYSNGILEGINNKIKIIKRVA